MSFFDALKRSQQVSAEAANVTDEQVSTYVEELLVQSYNGIVEKFAAFGESAKAASTLADTYLQNGTGSAIDTPGVGASLKSVWTSHADPEFDNFIKCFDIWSQTMIEENRLNSNFFEQVQEEYMNNAAKLWKIKLKIASSNLGEENNSLDLLTNSKYMKSDRFYGILADAGIIITDYDHYIANRFSSYNYSSEDDYNYRLGRLSPEVKAAVLEQNSRDAENLDRTYPDGGAEFDEAYEKLNPGQKAAYDALKASKPEGIIKRLSESIESADGKTIDGVKVSDLAPQENKTGVINISAQDTVHPVAHGSNAPKDTILTVTSSNESEVLADEQEASAGL